MGKKIGGSYRQQKTKPKKRELNGRRVATLEHTIEVAGMQKELKTNRR